MFWRDFVFEKSKGCKNAAYKALLVVLNTSSNQFVSLFVILNHERVAFPELQVSRRDYIHVGHYPDCIVI